MRHASQTRPSRRRVIGFFAAELSRHTPAEDLIERDGDHRIMMRVVQFLLAAYS